MNQEIQNQDLDLLQAARCEDLKYNQLSQLTVLSNNERQIVDKLKLGGAHLLQGARGVGKSQLLRQAEIELDQSFAVDKRLSVYINFKTSPLLEGVTINDKSAFQVWIGAKIIQSIHQKLTELNVINPENLDDPYQRVFNIDGSNTTQKFLTEKLHLIQSYGIFNKEETLSDRIGEDFISKVNDVNYVREIIGELIKIAKLDRIIFLFDEVAHTFIPSQQEIFFEIFKLLQGDSIAVKAAVYPTVTSYGRNFEIGHDALLIDLDRFGTGSGLREMRTMFREIIEKRLDNSNATRKKIFSKGELLDECIYMSSGNPRAFLHLLLRALDNYTVYGVRNAIQSYVDSELIPYHNTVSKRLPRFSNHVSQGIEMCRNYIIQEIRYKNNRDKKSGYQSAFFTIDRDMSPNLKIALDILCYSGVLTRKGTVKIAGKRTGQRYMVNLSLLYAEKAFNSNTIKDVVASLSLTDYREFSSSDSKLLEYTNKIKEGGDKCSKCGEELNLGAKFCSNCGSKVERTSLVSVLLDDSIEQLPISKKMVDRVIPLYPKVGDLLQATKDELMAIQYVGPFKSRIIKNAVEEYIAG